MSDDPKYIIISLEGNIASGKTSIIDYLDTLPNMKTICEPTYRWKKLMPLFYIDKKRQAFSVQVYVMVTRVEETETTIKKNPDIYIFITERSVDCDKNVFVKTLYEDGDMTRDEVGNYNVIFNYWVHSGRADGIRPSHFIYIRTDPKICYKRIQERGRSEEVDGGISLDYLEKLDKAHDDWLGNEDNVIVLNGDKSFDLLKRQVVAMIEGITG